MLPLGFVKGAYDYLIIYPFLEKPICATLRLLRRILLSTLAIIILNILDVKYK
jgi:hypothetical protein